MRKHRPSPGPGPRAPSAAIARALAVVLACATATGTAWAQAFVLEIQAPPAERALLAEHLSLPRYQALTDLDEAELDRLLLLAEREARSLLGTLGEFNPGIEFLRDPPPELALDTPPLRPPPEPGARPSRPPRVVLRVSPGPLTRVASVDLAFEGDIAVLPAVPGNAAAIAQRESLRRDWSLPPGQRFTQALWDEAKARALRALQARRYPRARLVASLADIDARLNQARLGLRLDSGPRIRLGPLVSGGLVHHTPLIAQRFARLPVGADYDAQTLLDAQDRLVASGYFSSAFLHVDPEADLEPGADPGIPGTWIAPVQATLREAPLRRVVLGLGFATDQGLRASLEHRHLQVPGLGGRADSRLELQSRTPSLQTEWLDLPDARGWRRGALVRLERQRDNGLRTDALRLRLGRLLASDRIDRHLYLQWDQARVRGATPDADADAGMVPGAEPGGSNGTGGTSGTGRLGEGRALTANYAWTTRRFDRLPEARRGWGLALELGLGVTLGGERAVFQRSNLRGLWLHPLEGSRLQLRGEAGAVIAPDGARVPATALFRTGGDTSVRGYTLREIGAPRADGSTGPGRFLAVGSVEWLRPLRWAAWEQAWFIDTGAVADRLGAWQPATGVGSGLRYASAVGPLRADLAWGLRPRRLRLHLSVGMVF